METINGILADEDCDACGQYGIHFCKGQKEVKKVIKKMLKKNYKIRIQVLDEDEEVLAEAGALGGFESAEYELGRLERFFERQEDENFIKEQVEDDPDHPSNNITGDR